MLHRVCAQPSGILVAIVRLRLADGEPYPPVTVNLLTVHTTFHRMFKPVFVDYYSSRLHRCLYDRLGLSAGTQSDER